MATSFFNDKNRNIAPVLAELIVEANQELPDWLEEVSRDSSRGGRGCNSGRRGGGQRFGGRDHRLQGGTASGGRPGGFSGTGPPGNAFGNSGNSGGFNNANGSNWGGGPPQRQISAGPALGGGFVPSGSRPQQSNTAQQVI